MEEVYVKSEIKDMPIPKLKNFVAALVSQTIMDYGREIKPNIEEHLVKRTYEIITSPKYKRWQWKEVMIAFEKGKRGDFAGESRISVSNIERWMWNYGNQRSRQIVEARIQEAQAHRNNAVDMMQNTKYSFMFHELMTKRLKAAKEKREWDEVPSLKDVMKGGEAVCH